MMIATTLAAQAVSRHAVPISIHARVGCWNLNMIVEVEWIGRGVTGWPLASETPTHQSGEPRER
jgi:hypothetical protein